MGFLLDLFVIAVIPSKSPADSPLPLPEAPLLTAGRMRQRMRRVPINP